MRKIIWLDSAVNDIVRLREFIAVKNAVATKKAAETLKQATNKLVQTPLIGKPDTNLPEYRDLYIRFGAAGYVLRYRVYYEKIYIVSIRHYRESGFKSGD